MECTYSGLSTERCGFLDGMYLVAYLLKDVFYLQGGDEENEVEKMQEGTDDGHTNIPIQMIRTCWYALHGVQTCLRQVNTTSIELFVLMDR